jgi:phage shock protein PspC (stress-responsive transcriptional regulator)
MDKTININLGGTMFQIDEDAFKILRDYLQAINNRFANLQGGNETVEDIESRIAEIFQSQRGLAGVITTSNVEEMIKIIGKPEDFDHGEAVTGTPVYSSQRRRMYRDPEDKIIGGVCSGIAAYLNTDPVLFRILFVLAVVFFGLGFFIYIALWIALPEARSDSQKRAMFGNSYYTKRETGVITSDQITGKAQYHPENNNSSRLGNAVNEIFRAIGRVCYIILRIFLIIIGAILVLTGFLFILSFVMIFIFKYPGSFAMDYSSMNISYFPDFLNYIVNPATIPWIIILASIAVLLPMIALIYWGVKMIFWFRARDGVISLVALVVWVMAVAALTIICFNEGTSFAQTARSTVEKVIPHIQDTIYIKSDQKIADLKFNGEIDFPNREYSVFINDDKKELYIRPYLSVNISDDKENRLTVKRRSVGRTETEALIKSEGLIYNYSIIGDTLHLDEYFTSPSGRKWSADNIGINLDVPVGTILKFEKNSGLWLHHSNRYDYEEYHGSTYTTSGGIWLMTEEGLKPATENSYKRK